MQYLKTLLVIIEKLKNTRKKKKGDILVVNDNEVKQMQIPIILRDNENS